MSARGNHAPRQATIRVTPTLDRETLARIGSKLREEYGNPLEKRVSADLRRLLKRAFQIIRARQEPVNPAFVDEVLSILPELRVYAFSLERDHTRAEDLVQESVLKALSQHELFEAGTNLRSWLFTILKNQFLTLTRKRRREIEDANGAFAETLTVLPDQQDKLSHHELLNALHALREEQREVLVLVAIEGLSYEEAAAQMGCAVGTIKSRVNRARRRLAELMGLTEDDVVGWTRI